MTKFFLRLKHWQLFLLLFAIPFALQLAGMLGTIASGSINTLLIIFPFILVFVVFIYYGWFWAIGRGLKPLLPPDVNYNLRIFRLFLLLPLLYTTIVPLLLFARIGNVFGGEAEVPVMTTYFPFIVPMHLFSIFCIFYCLAFCAKTLKSVEFQREVTFSDYAGEFFLIWFYFVGVWIIQPRLNKLVERLEK